jgi:phosphoribosylformylglycinamidine synthase
MIKSHRFFNQEDIIKDIMIYRLFTEKKEGFNVASKKLKNDIKTVLGINVEDLRILLRYDIQGLKAEDLENAKHIIFSEPPCDTVYDEEVDLSGFKVFAVEYLPGQYDQRADSAEQCVQLLTHGEKPRIRCATVYALKGCTDEQIGKIKKYIINPVEAQEASLSKPAEIKDGGGNAEDVKIVKGFIKFSDDQIEKFHKENGFAMTAEDLKFVRDYFITEKRDPTETELKVIDTYWSDHCRHTTFLTELADIDVKGEEIEKAYELYKNLYKEINGDKVGKYPCLMDIATIGAKKLKLEGYLNDIDVSEEINACSINVKAEIDGKEQDYIVMFKNETHNHPTEIEPFGGAATCLGGAIRDPLSGRSYVYQAMRVTGSGNPLVPVSETISGKLPQRVITKTAAAGFSSYGNQIGLATGIVAEIYHEGYIAKRLETGFVVGAAPKENIYREIPKKGDVVVLLGGDTGRDGCGGATGSSKAHTAASVEKCGAEVQKGNPLTERKLQRLFRNKEVTRLIKKCNDFGAGGVCVAIGELAPSLSINLSAVPKKYSGLSGTELAISESQERMAVVISAENVQKFIDAAKEENLKATVVAEVTESGRLQMTFEGKTIVNLSRVFLDTNGVKQKATAKAADRGSDYIFRPSEEAQKHIAEKDFKNALLSEISRLNVCSNKGLGEMFDSTIGAGSVYMPFGGRNQLTPCTAMAAKLPCNGYTDDCTVSSYACYPHLAEKSPYSGGFWAVVGSVAKLIACGAARKDIRLTLQEYFKRLYNNPERWGQPLAALLGALYAQIGLKTAAIGGKDSMSGTFENIDVPPTLISFALAHAKADKIITNVLGRGGIKLYAIKPFYNSTGTCDIIKTAELYDEITRNIQNNNIRFAAVSEEGGIACAVVKSCIGNGIGFDFDGKMEIEELFAPMIGTIIISADDTAVIKGAELEYIGQTNEKDVFNICGSQVSVCEITAAYTRTLEPVFSLVKEASGNVKNVDYVNKEKKHAKINIVHPNVFIPVFPGTNCEYDTEKKFVQHGAKVSTLVVKNITARDIEETVKRIAAEIDKCQIIAFPGGFSGGDEPDGSGKFIATTFFNPLISESINRLLYERDGLIIGICNGFQALIKTGLVPYGRFEKLKSGSPTLTFNNISRHVSTLVNIRVASNKSPWLYGVKTGEVFTVPVSHGEGRFVCTENELQNLINNGQIATQYCTHKGEATMQSPFNPNGSLYAVEGITSPDGRVLGKMGHSERTGKNLYINCEGNFDMKIFESGLNYFK